MRLVTVGIVISVFAVCGVASAQDVGWPPAQVGETGQTLCYDAAGTVIACAGTGQDGDLQPGTAWPNPRFTDNLDGTVTDNLTGLIWLKDANCDGTKTWQDALTWANGLYDGCTNCGEIDADCGLGDGSAAGEWHLPSVNELQSIIDYRYLNPTLSDAAGTGQWSEGNVFEGVVSGHYWSSTTNLEFLDYAFCAWTTNGIVSVNGKTGDGRNVWPVRNGPTIFADGFGPGDARQWSAEAP